MKKIKPPQAQRITIVFLLDALPFFNDFGIVEQQVNVFSFPHLLQPCAHNLMEAVILALD